MSENIISKPLFENFTEEEIQDLLSVANVYKYEKDEFIFRQGDNSADIFIIFSGEVQLSVINTKNEEVIFPVASNGTILGEISFFDRKARTANIQALNDLEAIIISEENLNQLEKINPVVTIKVFKEIGRITAERLRWADTILRDLLDSKQG
jgi:CRP-like cAMP-binding protein